MDFPSTWQLIRHFNVFLLSGPVVLVVSAGFWFQWARSFRTPATVPMKTPRSRLLLFAVATLVIGAVHFLGIYASVRNAWKFRFEPREVAEIRVVRVSEEGTPLETPTKSISDRMLLTDGLSSLSHAESRRRNHEHYLDGYRMQIVMSAGASAVQRYLSVYRKSSRAGPVTVVIPHLEPGHQGTVQNAGEYTCPAFLDWVAKNVDPLFRDR